MEDGGGRGGERTPFFEKEEYEVKCSDSGASFVASIEEDKDRAIQEAISALTKQHGAEMRDSIEVAAKEARA